MIVFLWFTFAVAHAQDLSLTEFLTSAWEKSPTFKGEEYKEEESRQLVSSARGKYFPHVSLDAISTTGFPASNSDLHVGGVMGSPFRQGNAAGIVADEIVYDFGRIQSAMGQAKAQRSLNEAKLAQEKLTFLGSLGGIYLTCARVRSLQSLNEQLINWARLILKETSRFEKTGQRSIVDSSLVKSEVMELELQSEELKKLEVTLIEQMRVYARGRDAGC